MGDEGQTWTEDEEVGPVSGTTATAAAASKRGGLGSLVTCVQASAAVHGFALATWRGAANRDGFVLDIAWWVKWARGILSLFT